MPHPQTTSCQTQHGQALERLLCQRQVRAEGSWVWETQYALNFRFRVWFLGSRLRFIGLVSSQVFVGLRRTSKHDLYARGMTPACPAGRKKTRRITLVTPCSTLEPCTQRAGCTRALKPEHGLKRCEVSSFSLMRDSSIAIQARMIQAGLGYSRFRVSKVCALWPTVFCELNLLRSSPFSFRA